tara:strand:+ start:1426 stop:1650 length:225 start_codon:yes stop_codon:yes gene_type:complete
MRASLEAQALANLYRPMRLFASFFQPSLRLAEKQRDGAPVRKRYHAPLSSLSVRSSAKFYTPVDFRVRCNTVDG